MLLLKAVLIGCPDKDPGYSGRKPEIVCVIMVKAAFASWNDRIAPVFDVSRWIYMVEAEDGQVIDQNLTSVESDIPIQKAARLAELAVGVLVCGAISRPMQTIINAYGIEVIPFITGNLQEVIQAWLCGRLTRSAGYAMPGCPNAGGHFAKRARRAQGRDNEMTVDQRGKSRTGRRMAANEQGGKRPGRGGQGRAGQGRGRAGKTTGASRDSSASRQVCVCTRCGNREPHERGVPCLQKPCAVCGGVMTAKQEAVEFE